ncbi:MAG: thiol:disulfide interchange protein DsbA/DsbL [Wenzhouxiangella sp.]
MTRIAYLLVASLVLSLSLPATAQQFLEGQHFHPVGSPTSPPTDRVEVVEAFAYPCPACRVFLPVISQWSENLPEHVELIHMPVPLQPGWDVFARVWYTAEILGLGKDAHEAMFRALHDERRQFRNMEEVAEVYTAFGISVEEFISTSQSFAVDNRMRRNRNEIMRFGVRGTPTMIVQGKWRLSPSDFSSYEEMLAAVDYLVAREWSALEPSANGAEAAD